MIRDGMQVCVIVVTYNRKELLRRCLHALQAQTAIPDEILVVDNTSTDGTAEMLTAEFPTVQHLTLPENMGGAGGYYYGLQWAVVRHFEWVAVMDDDGHPAPDYLEKLLRRTDTDWLVRAPLVLSDQNPTNLAFKLFLESGPITTLAEAEIVGGARHLIPGRINPFNGILIARPVIEQIGLPEKEFFLWGDEYEYFLRMKKAGIRLGTVTEAHFYHPPDRMQFNQVRFLFRDFSVYYADNPLKDYLILRNHAYIVKKYRGWLGWLAHIIRYLIFYRQLSGFKQLRTVLVAGWHGATANFSHHKSFFE